MATQQLGRHRTGNAVAGLSRPEIDGPTSGGSTSHAGLRSVTGFLQLCASNALAHSFGQRIQGIAVAWVVLDLTGSKAWLGVINGLPTLAIVPLSLLGGVLADARDTRRILIGARVALAVTAMGAAILVSTGRVQEVHLLFYVLMVSSLAALDMPASRTTVHRIVGSARLLGANAAQSILVNLVNVVAPVSLGLLIAGAGSAAAFWLLAVGYALAVALMLAARVDDEPVEARNLNPIADIRNGFAYIRQTPAVRVLLALAFLVPVAGVYFAMVPVFARDVLRVGPAELGFLVASFSAGSLLASVYLAINRSPRHRGLRLTQVGVLFGAGVMLFALSRSFLMSTGVSFLLGLSAGFWQNMLGAMVQTATLPEMRGRVVSVFRMAFQLMGIGWLAAGILASLLGDRATLLGAGASFALISLAAYGTSKVVREID